MNSYVELDRLFGTPLNQIPKPQTPFKIKTWMVITGLVVVGLAAVGTYTLYNGIKSKFSPKEKEPESPSVKSNFKSPIIVSKDDKKMK